MSFFLSCLLSCCEWPELSEQSDQDDLEDAVEIELWSLSKPRSSEGDRYIWGIVVCSLSSSCCSCSLEEAIGGSLYLQGPHVPTGLLVEKPSEVLNLKGGWAGRFTRGCPGPVAFTP